MEIVFSEFYHEYIRYNRDDLRRDVVAGRECFAAPGTGCISGDAYTVVIDADGHIDDRHTRQR